VHGFLYLALQSLAGARCVGNQPRRFHIADQVHVLDAVLLLSAVAVLELGVEGGVNGDQ